MPVINKINLPSCFKEFCIFIPFFMIKCSDDYYYLYNHSMDKVNVTDALDQITDYWKPVIVGDLNQQHVKLVKVKGEFVMHHHEHEDEFFLVIKGILKMDFGDRLLEVKEGEFIIVPKGVKHRPIADTETHILLFEPESTLNTGNIRNELTHHSPKTIR